jgi:hypothetical protein
MVSTGEQARTVTPNFAGMAISDAVCVYRDIAANREFEQRLLPCPR